MEPVYILILAIAAMFTAALTILKIFSMKQSPEGARCSAHGQIEAEIDTMKQNISRRQSIKLCEERTENIYKDLSRGHNQFDTILKIQSQQADMLARIDERIAFLAEENGFGKRKK